MIPWIITRDVESALNRQAAVAPIGPRPVGKTTLALEIRRSRDALHLDPEDREDRRRLAEPVLFLDDAGESSGWRSSRPAGPPPAGKRRDEAAAG